MIWIGVLKAHIRVVNEILHLLGMPVFLAIRKMENRNCIQGGQIGRIFAF
jgi:hypothetical protein